MMVWRSVEVTGALWMRQTAAITLHGTENRVQKVKAHKHYMHDSREAVCGESV